MTTVLAVVAALVQPAAALADTPERVVVPAAPQGRVSDYAGVLDAAARASLEAQLLRYEQSGAASSAGRDKNPEPADRAGAPQIAVVILPSLGGDPLEDVSMRFAERWKIGSKADDGVLLLVATGERKIRLEVGYGAEGRLTDAQSARIIREIIAPRLRTGNFVDGLRAGAAAVHQALTGQPVTGVDPQAGVGPAPGKSGRVNRGKGFGIGGALILLLVVFLLSRRGGSGGGGFLAGALLGSLFSGGHRHDDDGGGGGGFSGGGGSFGGGGASGDY